MHVNFPRQVATAEQGVQVARLGMHCEHVMNCMAQVSHVQDWLATCLLLAGANRDEARV